MSDDAIKVTDPDNVKITFVNQVLGQGHLNSVVNITLGAARFTPSDSSNIDVDMVVAARLRMDIICASQLRDSLDALLKKILPEVGEKLN